MMNLISNIFRGNFDKYANIFCKENIFGYFLVICRPFYSIFYVLMENMMTSSNGNIFRVTALCAGNSPVNGEFPSQRPVTRSFDVFFDLCPNKPLIKQS